MIRKDIGAAFLAEAIIAPLSAAAQGVPGGVEQSAREGERLLVDPRTRASWKSSSSQRYTNDLGEAAQVERLFLMLRVHEVTEHSRSIVQP